MAVEENPAEIKRAMALRDIVRAQRQVAAALHTLQSADDADRRAAITALEHAHANLDGALAEFYGAAQMDRGRLLELPNHQIATANADESYGISLSARLAGTRLSAVEDRLAAIERRLRQIELHILNEA